MGICIIFDPLSEIAKKALFPLIPNNSLTVRETNQTAEYASEIFHSVLLVQNLDCKWYGELTDNVWNRFLMDKVLYPTKTSVVQRMICSFKPLVPKSDPEPDSQRNSLKNNDEAYDYNNNK